MTDITEVQGSTVHKLPKDHYKNPEPVVIYEFDHAFKHIQYYSDGICVVNEDGTELPDSFPYLKVESKETPLVQAKLHAARISLGVKEAFRVDSLKKLDWYHSKKVNIQIEKETVKTALKKQLEMLDNNLEYLERLEEDAAEFAKSLNESNITMSHGTVNVVNNSAKAVMDSEKTNEREDYLESLFNDMDKREKYDVKKEVVTSYKQDSRKIASEELQNYKNYLKEIEDIEPDENGELDIPVYTPKHPGWKINPASKDVYFRAPRAKQ